MSGGFRSTLPRSPIGSPADDFVLTLWTRDAALARRADRAGIQRIGVDLERLGKADRQRGLGTWVSPHTEADLRRLAPALTRAQLFARVNPINADTAREVDAVLSAGATVLMLPMVATPEQAAAFVKCAAGAARIVLLLERREALDRLADLIAVPGVDEVHVGLNDLALSLNLPNRWLVLANDVLLEAAALILAAGVRFGLGGLGRVDDDRLPVPSDLVYAEYARLQATAALVSRSFLQASAPALAAEVRRTRRRLADWFTRSDDDLDAAHAELGRRARRAAAW
jgi:hypothetical protein